MIPRIIYLAIFLSGFASLGYELCWIRKGALLIGATAQALSIVIAVFFGGMAAGAYLFGCFSKRTNNALVWYGVLECAIGLFAAITPLLFRFAGEGYAFVYHWTDSSTVLHIVWRLVLVAVIIFPPAVLMGSTLPLLCQFFINERCTDFRYTAGVLYAINATGAFLGCMLCGMCLIPFLGVNTAIWFNAFVSFSVGVSVILLSKSVSSPTFFDVSHRIPEFTPSTQLVESRTTGFILYGFFFYAGFAALGYEILWVRFLSLIIHNTIYTVIFSIGAVLLGIALGGLLVLRVRNSPRADVLLFAAANIFMGFSVLLLFLQPVAAWEWIRGSQSVSMQALLCLIIILIPSIASGATFPLVYRLVAASPINAGRDFGRLSAVNTLGGITGSLLVGFYLLPATGMYTTLLILALTSITLGISTIIVFVDYITLFRRRMIASGIIAVLCVAVNFSSTELPEDFLAGKREMIEFAEGLSSCIAVVRRDGDNVLEIDRLWQGQNKKGHQILAAHIPMILHQDPQKILVIGMGTGQTASRFLMYDIKHLDCVDVEKTVPDMLRRHFDAAWLDDPRTHVIMDDGRNFTSYTKSMYDIVSIEVGQSFRPQIASFYTVDFYRDVKKRLTKNGLACQFVPIGFFTEDQFRSVVGSFLEVFPQSTLWFNKYAECILIGSVASQPTLSAKRLELLQNNSALRTDLSYSFKDIPWLLMNKKEVFAANYLMGPQTLSRLSAGAPHYSDNRPVLEYQTAGNVYLPSRFHALIEKNMDSPDLIFSQKIRIAMEAKIILIREETVHDMLTLHN